MAFQGSRAVSILVLNTLSHKYLQNHQTEKTACSVIIIRYCISGSRIIPYCTTPWSICVYMYVHGKGVKCRKRYWGGGGGSTTSELRPHGKCCSASLFNPLPHRTLYHINKHTYQLPARATTQRQKVMVQWVRFMYSPLSTGKLNLGCHLKIV